MTISNILNGVRGVSGGDSKFLYETLCGLDSKLLGYSGKKKHRVTSSLRRGEKSVMVKKWRKYSYVLREESQRCHRHIVWEELQPILRLPPDENPETTFLQRNLLDQKEAPCMQEE